LCNPFTVLFANFVGTGVNQEIKRRIMSESKQNTTVEGIDRTKNLVEEINTCLCTVSQNE
jgi:hypothetical protein